MQTRLRILAMLLVLVLVVDLYAMLQPQQAMAQSLDQQQQQQSKMKQLIKRDANSETWDNGNGTYSTILGLPQYTYDEHQAKFVPHKVTILDSQHVNVQSGLIGWKIGPDNATITDANMTEDRVNEQWIVEIAKQKIPLTFNGQYVNDTAGWGVNVTNSYSASFNGAPITVTILYSIPDGQPAQRIVDIQGLSVSDIKTVRYYRQWTPLTDIDGVNVDGTNDAVVTTTKEKIATSELKDHTTFKKGGKTIIHENLKTADNFVEKVDYKKDSIIFSYSKFTTSAKLVDDTTTVTGVTVDGYIGDNSGSGTTCGGTTQIDNSNLNTNDIQSPGSETSFPCERSYVQWDTSGITDSATITSVAFKFEITSVSNAANCAYTPFATKPSSETLQQKWNDVGDGTPYVSSDSTCTTVGSNKSVTLGSAANTDLQNNLVNNWFAVGIKFGSETRTSGVTRTISFTSSDAISGTPKPQLLVTYTAPVTQPIQLSNGSGSNTFETAGTSATITCTGGGGTHDGNPASQNFICNPSTSVTLTLPSATSTIRWIWSDGSDAAKTFTSCSTGTCSTQSYSYYKQVLTNMTLSGLDSGYWVTVTGATAGTAMSIPYFASNDNFVHFNSAGQYIAVPDAPSLRQGESAGSEVTWAFWFKHSTLTPTASEIMIAKSAGTSKGMMAYVNTVGQFKTDFYYHDGTSFFGNSNIGVNDGNWHCAVIGQSNVTSTSVIYLDDVLKVSHTKPDYLASTSALAFTMGGKGASSSFAGDLDQVTIYNRLFAQSDVDSFCANHLPVTNGATAQFRLNEGTGTTTTDSISSNVGTLTNSPQWVHKGFSDQASTVTLTTTSITVTANQNRFQTYNSTAQRTVTANSASTKTYVYNHEYNELFRIHETHLGSIFTQMPLGTYTGTITTSNNTAIPITLNTQVTDDYLEPANSQRYWVKNGTTSWSNLTWRGMLANSTGSQSITSYGNFDIQSAVKHYGFEPGNYHFRYGVDSGTTSNMTYDSFNAKVTFNGTSTSGLHKVVVEFLPSLYSGVSSITVNGTALPAANYTITADNTNSPPVSVLTISNLHFSTKSFVINFIASSGSSGTGGGGSTGGGGGGGGGGSSDILPGQTTSPDTGVTNLQVIVPPYNVEAGQNQTRNITVRWTGPLKIIIQDVTFETSGDQDISFNLGQQTPFALTKSTTGTNDSIAEVPLTVSLSKNAQGIQKSIPMTVKAMTGTVSASTTVPVNINIAPSNDLAFYVGGIMIAIVIIFGIARRHKRLRNR